MRLQLYVTALILFCLIFSACGKKEPAPVQNTITPLPTLIPTPALTVTPVPTNTPKSVPQKIDYNSEESVKILEGLLTKTCQELEYEITEMIRELADEIGEMSKSASDYLSYRVYALKERGCCIVVEDEMGESIFKIAKKAHNNDLAKFLLDCGNNP